MLGNLMSMAGYYALFGLMWLWLCIKIGRSSPLLGIATFFISPLALYCLIRYWGDEDSDIRIPFLLAGIALGGAVWAGNRAVDSALDEAAIYLTDEDIAAVRAENPEYADQLEAARSAARANRGRGNGALRGPQIIIETDATANAEPASRAAPEPDLPRSAEDVQRDLAIKRRLQRRIALQQVDFQRGTIALPMVAASLQLAPPYRFAPAGQLGPMAQEYARPLDAQVLGWVVHERVDLASDGAWFVEVRFDPIGQVATPQASAVDTFAADALERLGGKAAGYAPGRLGPQWDARSGLLTWVRVADAPTPIALGQAAKPLRNGVLRFVAVGVPAAEAELALRATRLLATRTRIERGSEYAAHDPKRDAIASVDLAGYIAAVDGAP